MADKPLREMQALYRRIEAGEAEMTGYRQRLAERLVAPRSVWRPVLAATAAVAAAVLLGTILLAPAPDIGRSELATLQLAELQGVAADPDPALLARARELIQQQQLRDQAPEQWNALMLLALTEDRNHAVQLAARGLQGDPRPEFRYRYLEILLDEADEYQYNEERIVQLMDRETDKDCFRLYQSLLHLAT